MLELLVLVADRVLLLYLSGCSLLGAYSQICGNDKVKLGVESVKIGVFDFIKVETFWAAYPLM